MKKSIEFQFPLREIDNIFEMTRDQARKHDSHL